MRMPLRKKSRYQKAQRALRQMAARKRDELRARRRQRRREEARQEWQAPVLPDDNAGLHWLTAGLFVAAGAEAALGERRGDYRADAIRWAPMVAAPVAGAVQAARALWPSPTTRMIAQLVNGVALGVGAAGLAASVSDAMSDAEYDGDGESLSLTERVPSLAPLAFGAVGLLGLLLDNEDQRPRKRAKLIIRV